MGELQQKGQLAKEASYQLAVMTTEQKNKGLLAMADALETAMMRTYFNSSTTTASPSM